MAEYIKKEDAIAHPFANGHYDKANANRDFIRGHESYKEWLEDLPVADVRENKRGSWMTDSDGLFICSECEEHAPQRMMFHPQPFYWTCDVQLTNFCPNCGAELIPEKLRGADMREVKHED